MEKGDGPECQEHHLRWRWGQRVPGCLNGAEGGQSGPGTGGAGPVRRL